MSLPTNRDTFRDWILRRLGQGAIRINVTDQQVDDRIDEALLFWTDWCYDGSEKSYYVYQLTQADFDNKYITLPENVFGVVKVFEHGLGSTNVANPFNLNYQAYFSDLIYSVTRGGESSVIPYYVGMQYIQLLEQLLIGQIPMRYTRHVNKLYIDADWERLSVGEFIVVECYQTIDPDTYPTIWKDRWLLRYATALVKQQWGENLGKYGQVEMMGGVVFNGRQIHEDATAEIKELEEEMQASALPADDLIA